MSEIRICSCACGAVVFDVHGRIRSVANCHCTKCRKMNGSAFATLAVIKESDLTITAGDENIVCYQVSEAFSRHFCCRCGAPLFNVSGNYPGFRLIPIGAFDRPDELKAQINVYCGSMLDWVPDLMELASYPDEFTR